ncbi:MAG: hypothetical protein INQ03_24945 [Candidatus Heimdallarchaeota archaeon]|nr:hypothetical protein [Candidatus Heimdallarchaeota archaeon]
MFIKNNHRSGVSFLRVVLFYSGVTNLFAVGFEVSSLLLGLITLSLSFVIGLNEFDRKNEFRLLLNLLFMFIIMVILGMMTYVPILWIFLLWILIPFNIIVALIAGVFSYFLSEDHNRSSFSEYFIYFWVVLVVLLTNAVISFVF